MKGYDDLHVLSVANDLAKSNGYVSIHAPSKRVRLAYIAKAKAILLNAENKTLSSLDGLRPWQPIETAPKGGQRVELLIPYSEPQADVGYWEARTIVPGTPSWSVDGGCWRFDGDDGPYDIQPTHWRALRAETGAS